MIPKANGHDEAQACEDRNDPEHILLCSTKHEREVQVLRRYIAGTG